VSAIQGFLMSMEKRSGLSELSVISWVSAVEGCPLSGVPLYYVALFTTGAIPHVELLTTVSHTTCRTIDYC